MQSAVFLCFMCCGVHFEDDCCEGREVESGESGSGRTLMMGRQWDQEMVMGRDRRRVVLEGRPGIRL